MPFQQDEIQIQLQAKVFNFALTELVRQHRETFEPLWTVDSWVKFLIWMSLNSGLSGERKSLEQFADALGSTLTIRMRQIFFERTLDLAGLKVLADPAEEKVLVMPIQPQQIITNQMAIQAIEEVALLPRIIVDTSSWQAFESVIAIPWQSIDKSR